VPTLSIVIPAHNAAGFIEETVRSALAVGGVDCEVIVVDDGSTDGTAEACRIFGDAIRLKKIPNGGVSRARNIGAEAALGSWFLFLDSDDRLQADGPAALIGVAEKERAQAAYGLVREQRKPPLGPRITGQNHAAGDSPLPAVRNYWRCAVITPGSAVVHRELHKRIGGFVSGFEPMEDRDYWVKAGLLGSCAHADQVVLDKTWRPVSAGKMDARRIWNGLRSRFRLPKWCDKREIAWPEDLPRDERALLEKAVNEAVWCRCWEIVGPLLRACRARGLRSFWIARAAAEFGLRGGEKRYPAPAWILPFDD
jgi:glycosyltransferase involved in cell wall biosynthesis